MVCPDCGAPLLSPQAPCFCGEGDAMYIEDETLHALLRALVRLRVEEHLAGLGSRGRNVERQTETATSFYLARLGGDTQGLAAAACGISLATAKRTERLLRDVDLPICDTPVGSM